jgi:hypothetical protein
MKRTRLLLLGTMLTLVSMVSWSRVEAVTCQETCLLNESTCFSNCHGLGTCRTICGEVYTQCLAACGK